MLPAVMTRKWLVSALSTNWW